MAAAGVAARLRAALACGALALLAGVLLHTLAFLRLHDLTPPPPLTQLPLAFSLMAWIGALSYLLLLLLRSLRGARLALLALLVLVAPLAFLGTVAAALFAGESGGAAPLHPLWLHLHVLLASAGTALIGIAAAAGALYLLHHRQLAGKQRGAPSSALPSLEALDRANALALALGFLLVSLGLLTGLLGLGLSGAVGHASATALCWALTACILAARFRGGGARQSALHAIWGFLALLGAELGARLWL